MPKLGKIIIVDDNRSILSAVKILADKHFASVVTLPTPNSLITQMRLDPADVVLLDMNFSAQKLDGQEGLTWLRYIKQQENPPAVVMITAFGDINIAVNSLKEGAEDFITKPWDNDELVEKLLAAIDKCRQQKNLNRKASEADVLIEKQETLKQMTLDEVEKQHILEMMQECGNNLSDVARRLNIGRQKLYSKLKKYGLMV